MVKAVVKKEEKESVVPKVSRHSLKNRFNKLAIKAGDLKKKGIVYVGHLPRGFEEKELKSFFLQFE